MSLSIVFKLVQHRVDKKVILSFCENTFWKAKILNSQKTRMDTFQNITRAYLALSDCTEGDSV